MPSSTKYPADKHLISKEATYTSTYLQKSCKKKGRDVYTKMNNWGDPIIQSNKHYVIKYFVS